MSLLFLPQVVKRKDSFVGPQLLPRTVKEKLCKRGSAGVTGLGISKRGVRAWWCVWAQWDHRGLKGSEKKWRQGQSRESMQTLCWL